jgi:hypothetical protein
MKIAMAVQRHKIFSMLICKASTKVLDTDLVKLKRKNFKLQSGDSVNYYLDKLTRVEDNGSN